jgi:hypothetical protein
VDSISGSSEALVGRGDEDSAGAFSNVCIRADGQPPETIGMTFFCCESFFFLTARNSSTASSSNSSVFLSTILRAPIGYHACFAVYDFKGTFGTGRNAIAATITKVLIDFYDFAYYFHDFSLSISWFYMFKSDDRLGQQNFLCHLATRRG